MKYQKEQIIIFESGDWGDRCFTGAFQCLKSFDLDEQVELWIPENAVDYSDFSGDFVKVEGIHLIDWLVLKGFLKSLEVAVINRDICIQSSFHEYKINEYEASDKRRSN